RLAAGAARKRGRALLPPRPGAARAEGGDAARAPGAGEARAGDPHARERAAAGLARAHGAALPAGDAVPRAVPGGAAAPVALRFRPGGGGALARRAGRCLPCPAGFAPLRRDHDRPGGALRADQDFPHRRRKRGLMDSPLRLIASNPLDQLARTLEALLVVASAPLSVEELGAAADDDAERVEAALGLVRERY